MKDFNLDMMENAQWMMQLYDKGIVSKSLLRNSLGVDSIINNCPAQNACAWVSIINQLYDKEVVTIDEMIKFLDLKGEELGWYANPITREKFLEEEKIRTKQINLITRR